MLTLANNNGKNWFPHHTWAERKPLSETRQEKSLAQERAAKTGNGSEEVGATGSEKM